MDGELSKSQHVYLSEDVRLVCNTEAQIYKISGRMAVNSSNQSADKCNSQHVRGRLPIGSKASESPEQTS